MFECDNCGSSIADPGVKVELAVEESKVENGVQYLGDAKIQRELCPSCGSDVLKAIERVFSR